MYELASNTEYDDDKNMHHNDMMQTQPFALASWHQVQLHKSWVLQHMNMFYHLPIHQPRIRIYSLFYFLEKPNHYMHDVHIQELRRTGLIMV